MIDDIVEGGWIKSYHKPDSGTYARLENLTSELSSDRIEYFEKYRRLYFFDRLIPNQGMEETLQTLMELSGQPKQWLDLGASVTTLFWSTAVNTRYTENIEVCDIIPEALHVSKKFKESSDIPQCYQDALDYLAKDKCVIGHARSLPWHYHVFDCMEIWPRQMSDKAYDLITVIGLLGLSSSAKHYAGAFNEISGHLSPAGIMVGVDWVRNKSFIERDGHDNSYINIEHICTMGIESGMQLLSLKVADIICDDNYSHLFIWAFQRMVDNPVDLINSRGH